MKLTRVKLEEQLKDRRAQQEAYLHRQAELGGKIQKVDQQIKDLREQLAAA